ncbi:MAG: 6-carboxytetrahydropterin synthase QueD [Gammaproteobacteria bacterium]|nr:MAG: 6-carboxytetrahydropterin synthase QueD [Gammaproteobacteria bacterium]
MYKLKTINEFSSAHFLKDYDGDCKNLHGHNWQVETIVEAKKLNQIGIAIDFKQIRNTTEQVINKLDHTNLNDLEVFKDMNPTAENIAKYIYRQIGELINSENVKIKAITLWENNRCNVTYSET